MPDLFCDLSLLVWLGLDVLHVPKVLYCSSTCYYIHQIWTRYVCPRLRWWLCVVAENFCPRITRLYYMPERLSYMASSFLN